jgi:hypothetical protein
MATAGMEKKDHALKITERSIAGNSHLLVLGFIEASGENVKGNSFDTA